jgi:hypothetical protein
LSPRGQAAAKHLIVGAKREEHLLLRDAERAVTLRLDGVGACLKPIALTFLIEGLPDPEACVTRFAMLNHLIGSPRLKAQRSRRRIFMRDALVALDSRLLGATYQETAAVIHGVQRARAAWSSTSTAMKERMRHLLARGQALRDGAYRGLLA